MLNGTYRNGARKKVVQLEDLSFFMVLSMVLPAARDAEATANVQLAIIKREATWRVSITSEGQSGKQIIKGISLHDIMEKNAISEISASRPLSFHARR